MLYLQVVVYPQRTPASPRCVALNVLEVQLWIEFLLRNRFESFLERFHGLFKTVS